MLLKGCPSCACEAIPPLCVPSTAQHRMQFLHRDCFACTKCKAIPTNKWIEGNNSLVGSYVRSKVVLRVAWLTISEGRKKGAKSKKQFIGPSVQSKDGSSTCKASRKARSATRELYHHLLATWLGSIKANVWDCKSCDGSSILPLTSIFSLEITLVLQRLYSLCLFFAFTVAKAIV